MFDTLDHKILITELEHFGIRGVPFKLFEEYLVERTQSVLYNNKLSDILCITCGAPQGTPHIRPSSSHIYK